MAGMEPVPLLSEPSSQGTGRLSENFRGLNLAWGTLVHLESAPAFTRGLSLRRGALP